MKERRQQLEVELNASIEKLGAPFEAELSENDLRLVMLQTPEGQQPAILPVVDGEALTPERIAELVNAGTLDEAQVTALREKITTFGQRFETVSEKIHATRAAHRERMRTLVEEEARSQLSFSVTDIERSFKTEAVRRFLGGIVDDVVTNQLTALGEGRDITQRYQVNVILEHSPDEGCAVLVETQPSFKSLLGTIDRQVAPGGGVVSDHTMIRAGSLLKADGGFLVLEAREVLAESGAWRVLMRTLRTGRLEVAPQESLLFGPVASLKPEPIPVNVKVILIGDPGLYRLLDSQDPDFPHLFKVLADFDTSLDRDAETLRFYAGLLARLVQEESLPHFASDGLAALAEHGARIAGRQDRMTTRFGRLADLAREAAFVARRRPAELVGAEDVDTAIRRSKRRADLPARHFRRRIAEGVIRIQTTGAVVGQVNGLATTSAGPLTYGFPARITATIGPGHRGAINIEREARLSGAIHTKGFYILGGLLRHLLRSAGHPLAFSASIAFEQSYGGIDGDSASGAEMCCLISALTGVPLRQSIAMTGAIDQLGNIQPIGAATEKIEGFFDACVDAGLTGDQGVIIPWSNRNDLMLRGDVVEACAEGRFRVFAVQRIEEALEIFTGEPVGQADADGIYPEGSLLERAVERSTLFWRMVREGPAALAGQDDAEDADAAPGVEVVEA